MTDRVIIFDSNPGRVKAEIRITLEHPRDRESPIFRQLVERVYSIMTTAVVPSETALAAGYIGIGYRLPGVTVAQISGVLEEISQPAGTDSAELPELAEAMQMEVDDLFPILETVELLGFAKVAGRQISLTRHGKVFAEADIQRRKQIFSEHLLRHLPLAGHIRRVLHERPSQTAPEQRFLRELEDYVSEDEAERVLAVMIEWGRYAELFAYDYNSGILSTENPGEETVP